MKIRKFFKTVSAVFISSVLCVSTLTGCALSDSSDNQNLTESQINGEDNAPVSANSKKPRKAARRMYPKITGKTVKIQKKSG